MIGTSLKDAAAAFDAVWVLRDRRNAIDAEVAALQHKADKLAELANKPGSKARALLTQHHTSTMHAINNLLDERIALTARISPASSHACGIANAAARRLAA